MTNSIVAKLKNLFNCNISCCRSTATKNDTNESSSSSSDDSSSSNTETTTVKASKKNLIAKATDGKRKVFAKITKK